MNLVKKIRHEMNYLKAEDFLQVFVFLAAAIPSALYTLHVKITKQEIWLICEDKKEARDNGWVFFSYLNNIDCSEKVYYAIDYNSVDFDKVNKRGKTVKYGSLFHWMLYFASKVNISTQKAGRPNAAVGYVLERTGLFKEKFVFLQHGITINKATWLFYDNTRMRMFICGAKPEYDYVREYFGYPDDNVKYTGFCRFDDYHSVDVNRKHIVLMPSWREWIGSKNEFSDVFEDTSVFENTEYYRKYQSLINNKKLAAYLKDNDLTLYFYPHRNMQQFIESFSTDCENIRIVSSKEADIRALLMESAVMITDYSNVAIDFAYMKKPVIYYQFDEERFRKAQYEKGYFDYRDSGLGVVLTEEDDVVEELIEIYGNGLEPDAAFLKAHGQFFPLFDDNNCERVYEAIKSIYR